MKRVMILIAVVLSASGSAAGAVIAVPGTGNAGGCFEAAQKGVSPRGALRLCDRALSDDPLSVSDRAATYVNRGIVRMQAGNFAAAVADYDAAISISPDTAEAYVNKGIALQRVGRDAEAVALFSEGIARNPARPELAYYSRAMAHETLGKTREAYEDYSRAVQLAPDWAEPAEQLLRFKTIRTKTLTA